MALQSSQRLPELLFYTKKSYRILQLQFQLQFYKGTHTPSTSTHAHYREFSIQNTILHAEDKELFEYYSTGSRNSTHRRQGNLLEMHPCVLQDLLVTFQAFQPQVLTKATPVTPLAPETFRTFQSFMTFQPFQAILQILQVPVSPGIPPHSSILQLECIFYSSIGFHRKLHRVPVEQLQTLQTLHSSKKGRCCDIGQFRIGKNRCQDDIFPRIELFPLSSCQVIILIARMTFNCSTSCLMSKVSTEITINTSRCYERAKQWNDNSQFSSHS